MILRPSDVERINAASLRLLERVGIRVSHAGILARLLQAGATQGAGADVALIPRGLVADCLARAPREITLCDLGGRDVTLGPGAGSVFWTGNALNICEGNQSRPITEPDFVNWTRLTDALPNVHAAVAPTISEYPPWSRDFVGFRLLAQNTRKHFRPCIYTPDGAVAIIEMAQALLGGTPLRERPIVSFGYTVTSPLGWGAAALELFEKTSGHGAPMMINAEPTAGATSPVTLAGTLALANAEALSGVVITQILEPGRPIVFNLGFSHALDMRSAITRTGGPENALLGAAGAQLAAFHGLPSASWASTESMVADAQAAYEFGMVAQAHALAGVNIIWGIGQLEAQRAISLEQGVITDEIAGAVLHLQRGVPVTDETLAEGVIGELGHKADYLGHDHTLRHFREALYHSALAYCGRREPWEQAGAQDLCERARTRVSDVLAGPFEPMLNDDDERALLSIEAEWMERLRR